MAFVHPFDDPDVVAGQGTLGLELLDDVPDLRQGRRARSAAAGWRAASPSRSSRRGPRSRSSACRSTRVRVLPRVAASRRAGRGRAAADDRRRHRGQAPRRADPRRSSRALARRRGRGRRGRRSPRRWCCCMEKAKLVVEGAGAVGVAALLGGQTAPARARHDGRRAQRRQRRRRPARRRSRAATRARPGRRLVRLHPRARPPGSLARLLSLVGEAGANLVDVEHVREGSTSTCARPRCSSCSRRAGASTPTTCSRGCATRATRPASCAEASFGG